VVIDSSIWIILPPLSPLPSWAAGAGPWLGGHKWSVQGFLTLVRSITGPIAAYKYLTSESPGVSKHSVQHTLNI
jgi:hypothetical protein